MKDTTPHFFTRKNYTLFRNAKVLQIGIFLVTTAVLSGLAYLTYERITGNIRTQLYARRQALVLLTATVVKENFDAFLSLGTSLASRPQLLLFIQQERWDEAIRLLERIPHDLPFVNQLLITNTDGIVMAATPALPSMSGMDFSSHNWYQDMRKEWNPYISNIYRGSAEPYYKVIAAAIPITSPKGTPLGVLMLHIRVENLLDWSDTINFGEKGFFYLVDRNGHAVAHLHISGPQNSIDFSALTPVREAQHGYRGITLFYDPFEQSEQIAAYAPIEQYGWTAVVSQPTATMLNMTEKNLPLIAVTGGFLLLVSIALIIQLLIRARRVAITRTQQVEKIVIEKTEELHLALQNLHAQKTTIERKEAEAQAVLFSIGHGLITVDRVGKITMVNNSFEDMLGWKKEEVIGKNLDEIVQKEDETGNLIAFQTHILPYILKGKRISSPADATIYFIRKDKSKFPVTFITTPIIVNQEIIGAVEGFRDISREKELDRAKSEFVSLASHQLRTPPTTIKWYLDILLDYEGGLLNQKQKEYMREIYHSNQRMIELINALLNVARIESGKFAIHPKPISLEYILKEIIHDMDPHIKQKNVRVREEYDTEVSLINADPDLIRIIFQNLISNSIKYSREQGIIHLRIRHNATRITISVADNGYGIPPAQQDKIFTKLFRADNARTMDPDGTGLGLYLVKSIVKAINGRIWFESALDKGTTFYVVLPMQQFTERAGESQLILS